jgi:GR25 family glycosyltransferase involved in LPS biosynthesis
MTALEQFVDRIFVINLARRTDRWAQFEAEMLCLGIENYIRFDAHEFVQDGKLNGHAGCVASHRGVLEIIGHSPWRKCLVFEDDVALRKEFRKDWQKRFLEMWQQADNQWDLLYLGGHYADKPLARVAPNVIRAGRMFTTSSYIITKQAARRMAPYIYGNGPIDVLFSGFAEQQKHYIFEPRLFIQRPGFSDLLEENSNNEWAMTDTRHVQMLGDQSPVIK